MGLLSSKDGQASNEFKTAASKFTSGELQAMQTAFEKAAHQPISEARLKQDAFLGSLQLMPLHNSATGLPRPCYLQQCPDNCRG